MRLVLLALLITSLQADYKCVNCHGVDGNKSAFGKTRKLTSFSKKEFLKTLDGYRNGTVNIYGMGKIMKGQLMRTPKSDDIIIAESLGLK